MVGATLFSALFLWPVRGGAEGALVVGVPPSVVESGVAIGFVTERPDAATASREAMELCRKRGEATTPNSIASFCTQVGKTFHDQCLAIAMDPEDGTPGVGWAIAPTQASADQQALANCAATAGADRREHCTVAKRACDGKAK